MQAETSKQEGPLPSQGIGWRAYRTHWEPTGGRAAEYRGGASPIFSVVSGCGHPLQVPPLAVEQEKEKGSDGSTLEPGRKPLHPQPPTNRAGGMPTGPAPSLQSPQRGQQADAG